MLIGFWVNFEASQQDAGLNRRCERGELRVAPSSWPWKPLEGERGSSGLGKTLGRTGLAGES